MPTKVVVIGGGAAGFFAAIACAEANPAAHITILERGQSVLQKVRVSGGGRCNVTHACFDARELTGFYPRGSRELLAPFLQFGPQHTVDWFARRGVRLKTEADGRMFPVTDDSHTIVECLWQEARKAGIEVRMGVRVDAITLRNNTWQIGIAQQTPLEADKVLVATGSSTAVWDMLARLGHRIVPPVPSLFTFNIKDPRLRDLAGVSVPLAQVNVPGAGKLSALGPLLVTHWGLSGPAILRLSAWGARSLNELGYQFDLQVNWTGETPLPDLTATMNRLKTELAKKQVLANPQFSLPARLWEQLCTAAGIAPALRWADMDKKTLQALTTELGAGPYRVRGKSTFKEEFVTAGGVDLREVNFKTFESKLFPGLYFAGEVLDIDAITGGFNFQAAWTGGWIAGRAIAASETTRVH